MDRVNGMTDVSISTNFQSLVTDLQTLLNDENTADVMFYIGREEVVFYAHKLFLWAR